MDFTCYLQSARHWRGIQSRAAECLMTKKAHSTVHALNSCIANSARENVYEPHGRASSVCSGCGKRDILGSSACTQSESVEREPEDRFLGETPRSPTGEADD